MEQARSEAGRALAVLRKREKKVCPRCGKEFMGIKEARFCSHTCTVRAYREANREELNRKRREKYHRQKGADGQPAGS